MKTKVSIITLSAIVLNTLVVPGAIAQRKTSRFRAVRGAATTDTVNNQALNKTAQASDYVNSLGAKNAVGEALENTTADTQTPSTPDTEGSTGTLNAELVVKMKKMDSLHNSLLSETINTCSGISRDLDTIKGLITGTIVSSGLGTVAAGGALATSLMKYSNDKEIEEARQTAAQNIEKSVNKTDDKIREEYDKIVAKYKVNDFNFEDLSEPLEEKDIKKITDYFADVVNKTIDPLKEELLISSNDAISKTLASEADKFMEAEKTAEETKALADFKTADALLKAYFDNIAKTMTADKYLEMVRNTASEAKAIAEEQKSKTLGNITIGLLAGATVTSAVSTATSFSATGNVKDLIDAMNKCFDKVNELKEYQSAMKAEYEGSNNTEVSFDNYVSENYSFKQGSAIVNTCSKDNFDMDAMEAVKKNMVASGITSAVGIGTAAAGTTTATLSNLNKEKLAEKKKGLNIATSILAGVTTGTSATSTVTSGIAMSKLNKNVDNFKNCDEALKDSFLRRQIRVDYSYRTED